MCLQGPSSKTGTSGKHLNIKLFISSGFQSVSEQYWNFRMSYLFCSSNLAKSSNSSGLKFSESEVGEHAGMELTEESASWEEESGLTAGLAISSNLRVTGMFI